MNLIAAFAMYWTLIYGALVVALLLGYRLPWGKGRAPPEDKREPLILFLEM
jgi:hypothetical protein